MIRAGRNDPCSCGSGVKFKRCCIDRTAELEQHIERLARIATLPLLFPRLRPANADFEAWAAPRPAQEHVTGLIREAIDAMGSEERARILRAASALPSWEQLRADVGDGEQAEETLLMGAAAAALREEIDPDPQMLRLVEETEVGDDPLEALSFALEPAYLWDVQASVEAERTLAAIPDHLDDDEYEVAWHAALDDVAAARWTPEHERRLTLLVERVGGLLPLAGYPRASAAIAAGCELYATDPDARPRLGRLLLSDTVGPHLPQLIAELAAAA